MEGLGQLKRFRGWPAGDRDRIVSEAVAGPVSDPSLYDVLMTRTSFGTAAVWTVLDGAVPANPPLLKGAMNALLAKSGEARASDIVASLGSLLEELLAEAVPRWETIDLVHG